ncbi:DNA polymerase III subunit beta [Liquorilactobacillus satsumensis]|uniref:Beta sliding clamp n=1 Tax=Liquorilactobacillus satsumensis DSM 16230 = JCM 12392 TaxID=1423801 RepID=A0A0R1V224_9LACO|nr:DNA polymerase III subunit beta [Liquorilactobacillus satsumensis]KRL96789.1 DNA-directed DNA polymerase III subunit beta [Liquorilactobacillus satsumensis DSM 16230 = JCM 12392]MCC7666471.1 DNA polymerase III subunit beta [Liquorilactobacillus satsumensis]MCP9328896.1 DNA polymerase III subunit beta [Liquorilactobacillus satsumensis]MCP9356757.1 DNA polymerase III subunit beta [Liquorilactobacillus satsumensis]MCP9370697.1 DNA polymerase III subunit beta [Liquorilactobacillus satsumensis]
MKFTVNRTAFLKSLSDVQRAISTKTTIPILTGLKLKLEARGLTLTGSDADISIETFIAADDDNAELQIEQPGQIVLAARIFSEIVKKLPEKTMTFEVTENYQTEITSGSASFTIKGLDADNYPRLPEIDAEEKLEFKGDLLKQLIGQTVIAVSTQESRPILTGIHLVIKEGELLAVATDSHRLSQRKIALPAAQNANYDIIIPGRSLNELAKMIPEEADKISLRISENQVLFDLGKTTFYSRLLEGNYPDTERLIPKTAETSIEFNAADFLAAIERASLLSHEGQNNVVKLVLETAVQKATIYGNSPEVGNVEEELHFQNLTGNDIEISFNPDYMKDALRSFGQTTVTVAFTLPLRPFTLVPSEDHEHFVQLITPVRTF